MNKITSALILSLFSFSLWLPTNFVRAETEAKEFSFFRASPRLVDSNTSFSTTNVLSRYNFYIDIPSQAENNLNKIVINQQTNLETIKIYPEKTKVFILTNQGENSLDNSTTLIVNEDENTSQIVINLSSSIPPDSRIKVVLRARNPLYEGIYQFGVAVYPEGDNPRSLYLGIARFHFYRHGRF